MSEREKKRLPETAQNINFDADNQKLDALLDGSEGLTVPAISKKGKKKGKKKSKKSKKKPPVPALDLGMIA